MKLLSNPRTLFVIVIVASMALEGLHVPSVRGYTAPYANSSLNSLPWSPFGPRMSNLLITVEGDSTYENLALTSGNIDLTDEPLDPTASQSWCPATNTAIVCTGSQKLLDVFQIDFNHASTFWNIPFDNGNSIAGKWLRQGIAHLIDKIMLLHANAGYVTADPIDCFSPTAQNLPCSGPVNGNIGPWNGCNWDMTAGVVGWFPTQCVSAYNFKTDSDSTNGTPAVGSQDYCAAEVDFLNAFNAAGIGGVTGGLTSAGTSCSASLGGVDKLGTIYFWVVNDDPVLADLGDALAGAINNIMGRSDAVTECATNDQALSDFITPLGKLFGNHAPRRNSVQSAVKNHPDQRRASPNTISFSCPTLNQNDWNMITTNWSMSSVVDQFYWFYNSRATPSNPCSNPFHYCRTDYDHWSNMVEFNASYQDALSSAQAAEDILGSTVASIPLYSLNERFAYLNGWNRGVINQLNAGTFNSWTALNAWRPDPAVPATIRWGFSESIHKLNPFTSDTPWEIFVLGEIYDSMLAVDPNTGGVCQTQDGGTAHCIDWTTTSHSQSFDTTSGLTTQTWNLRNDIFFQDGFAVTSHDVCFSILAYRDAPSASFQSSVANVMSCGTPNQHTVQVVLKGHGLFDELSIGGLFILPEHVWAPPCGGIVSNTDSCSAPSSLTNSAFDPAASGDLVGSGPWICNPVIGVSTIPGQSSCTQNANGNPVGQVVTNGGRVLLKRYVGYVRCCDNLQVATHGIGTTNLQVLEWSDGNKDGKVTIADIAAVAAVYGNPDPYWSHPIYSANPSTGTADIGDVATVSYFFDDGITAPFTGSPTGPHTSGPPPLLAGIDPLTDPFRADLGGVIAYYFGVTSSGSGGTTVQIGVIAGTVPSGSGFTAQLGSEVAGGNIQGGNVQVLFHFFQATPPCATIVIHYVSATTNVTIFTMAFGNCG